MSRMATRIETAVLLVGAFAAPMLMGAAYEARGADTVIAFPLKTPQPSTARPILGAYTPQEKADILLRQWQAAGRPQFPENR